MKSQIIIYEVNYYSSKRIEMAKSFMEANYEKRIGVEDVVAAVFLSKFHFCRLFKKHACQSPYQYLLYLRVEHAKRLLSQGRTVSDAAVLSGFNTLQHFSHAFSCIVKMSPSAYRALKE